MRKKNNIKSFFWFQGFLFFQQIVHPLYWPLRILKRLYCFPTKKRQSNNHGTLVPKKIPKKIWTFWAQGWEEAPPLVRLCRDSWIIQNPGWEVVQLTKEDIFKYVDLDYSLEGKELTYTNYSNILRVAIMEKNGGIWVDTTAFCARPLDSWLPQLMQSGFFAFHKPKTTVADWFMAVEENHILMKFWRQYVNSYWKYAKNEGRYFWPHYLFEYLITLNPVVRDVWRSTPKISADGPYTAQRLFKGKNKPTVDAFMEVLLDDRFPIHKLDWRIQMPDDFLVRARKYLDQSNQD